MEIEGEYPEFVLDDIRIVRATRQPCPVCGHPTGDCSEKGQKPAKIIGWGTIPSLVDEQDFLVEEDVVVERQITPYTKAKVIVAHAGQRIPLTKAKELGLF